jgi:hypothetical protein
MLTVAVERVKINFDRFPPPALKICSYPAAGHCARSTVLPFYVLSSWICKSLTTSVNEHVANNTGSLYVKLTYQLNQEQDFDSSTDVYASVLWVILTKSVSQNGKSVPCVCTYACMCVCGLCMCLGTYFFIQVFHYLPNPAFL